MKKLLISTLTVMMTISTIGFAATAAQAQEAAEASACYIFLGMFIWC